MSTDRPVLLTIQHVSWEAPHRILEACAGLEVRTVEPLAGDSLPSHAEVSAALVMGGPMNADEVERYPGLAAEREWLAAGDGRGGQSGARPRGPDRAAPAGRRGPGTANRPLDTGLSGFRQPGNR